MRQFLEKNYKIIIGVILSFIAIVSLLNAWNDSAIFDETAHIGAAYSYVARHEIRLNPEHPPLIKDLAGLPLLFMDLNFDTSLPFWTGELKNKWDDGQWASGRHLLYEAGNNPDKIIFWSRFPIIILSIILGLFIFKWSKELAGTLAGLIALAFYAFDPNILGHNHFVTTDLGIAAFMAFSFYYYLKFIKNPAWKNALLAGIFLGLLMLAKFSFIIALPVFALATVVYPLVSCVNPEEKNKFILRTKKFGEYIGKGALVFFISLMVVWIVYTGNTFKMQKETVSRMIEANFPVISVKNPKEIYTNKVLHLLNDHAITRPFTNFGVGIGYVFRRVSGGNGAYFMGQVSSTAFPAYFPTVFLIKESIPALFFMLFALILGFVKIISTFRKSFSNFLQKNFQSATSYLRAHIVEFAMLVFIFLYACISITGNLNIGFRHLFPILPFIYILTAKSVANFLKNKFSRHKALASYEHNSPEARESAISEVRKIQKIRIFSAAFSLIFAYLILGTIFTYPNYMSYFNEAAGGPKSGYRFVTDSNADWGQDLKRLRSFLNNHPDIGKIRVDYFGGGDIKTYIGDKYGMWWDSKRPIEPGWYAISANFLQGSLYDKTRPDNESYRWLKSKKPAYQAGASILIYYVTPEEAVAANN